MKKIFLLLTIIFSFGFSWSQDKSSQEFCTQLSSLVEAASAGFENVRMEKVKEKIISWGENEYYKTSLHLDESTLSFITTEELPVYKAIYFTDVASTPAMMEKYNALQSKIRSCLGNTWKFSFEDNSDILYSSSFVAKQQDKPEIRLVMYDNGTGMVVLELRITSFKK